MELPATAPHSEHHGHGASCLCACCLMSDLAYGYQPTRMLCDVRYRPSHPTPIVLRLSAQCPVLTFNRPTPLLCTVRYCHHPYRPTPLWYWHGPYRPMSSPMQCPVLTYCMLLPGEPLAPLDEELLNAVLDGDARQRSCLRASYAMPGTNLRVGCVLDPKGRKCQRYGHACA
eukprot:3941591-Rhodomonas_salina.3